MASPEATRAIDTARFVDLYGNVLQRVGDTEGTQYSTWSSTAASPAPRCCCSSPSRGIRPGPAPPTRPDFPFVFADLGRDRLPEQRPPGLGRRGDGSVYDSTWSTGLFRCLPVYSKSPKAGRARRYHDEPHGPLRPRPIAAIGFHSIPTWGNGTSMDRGPARYISVGRLRPPEQDKARSTTGPRSAPPWSSSTERPPASGRKRPGRRSSTSVPRDARGAAMTDSSSPSSSCPTCGNGRVGGPGRFHPARWTVLMEQVKTQMQFAESVGYDGFAIPSSTARSRISRSPPTRSSGTTSSPNTERMRWDSPG